MNNEGGGRGGMRKGRREDEVEGGERSGVGAQVVVICRSDPNAGAAVAVSSQPPQVDSHM